MSHLFWGEIESLQEVNSVWKDHLAALFVISGSPTVFPASTFSEASSCSTAIRHSFIDWASKFVFSGFVSLIITETIWCSKALPSFLDWIVFPLLSLRDGDGLRRSTGWCNGNMPRLLSTWNNKKLHNHVCSPNLK